LSEPTALAAGCSLVNFFINSGPKLALSVQVHSGPELAITVQKVNAIWRAPFR